ncbi:hypothetical protein BJV78DRAFT_1241571, partial [Lactifluus subvellereus]
VPQLLSQLHAPIQRVNYLWCMPDSFLPPVTRQAAYHGGRRRCMEDARHLLTGGGATVALSNVVLLALMMQPSRISPTGTCS